MKLLYIAHPHSEEETDDFYQSFSKISDTLFYEDLEESLEFKPDFIYLQSGGIEREDLSLLKSFTGAKIAQWTGDCRKYALEPVTRCQDLCDITYLAGMQPELYGEHKWLPHGVADWQFRDINPKADGTVFIGNAQLEFEGGRERHELCESLLPYGLTWYGTGSPNGQVPYDQTPDVYNKHKFAISASIYNDVPMYFSNRPLAAMAAGCIVLQKKFPEYEKYYHDPRYGPNYIFPGNCFIYDENYEAINIVAHYGHGCEDHIDHDKMRLQAQKLVRDNYHYDVLAKQVIDELTELS